MLNDLPERIAHVVKKHLLADDFRKAKLIHDEWLAKSQSNDLHQSQ